MFMDLEKILPPGVRVLSIEPAHEKGRVKVRLTVGAASDEAKLKFLHALEESRSFTQVELMSSRENVSGSPGADHTEVELTAVYSRT
jgi:Tfp pilus assembly protein PilN